MDENFRVVTEERAESRSFTFEWDREVEPSTAIVEAISTATGQKQPDREPLFEYVDVDALNSLIVSGFKRESGVRISFTYEEVSVTINPDGTFEIAVPKGSSAERL